MSRFFRNSIFAALFALTLGLGQLSAAESTMFALQPEISSGLALSANGDGDLGSSDIIIVRDDKVIVIGDDDVIIIDRKKRKGSVIIIG